MVPVSKEVLLEEIEFTQRVLKKWQDSLNNGIPEHEIPASEGSGDMFFHVMCGELALLSDKLSSLARLLSEASV